jgi:quercetin dioxygenase-like cupin family protein
MIDLGALPCGLREQQSGCRGRVCRLPGRLHRQRPDAGANQSEQESIMKHMLCAATLVLAGAGLGTTHAGAQESSTVKGDAMIVKPTDLKWSDGPVPGAQIAVIEGKMDQAGPITARLKLAPNTRIPPHWHPGVERVTVLSGVFNYGRGDKFDQQTSTALGPGSAVIMPPRFHHFAWAAEETVIQLNVAGPWGISYVNPADAPKKK